MLDQILSGDATETVVENIHEFLRGLGEDVRQSRLPLDAFIIHKRLGKNPEEYPSSNSLPHVQVALRMKSKGISARAGDVIPYVFCKLDGDSAPVKSAQADRAFHPDDLRRSGSTMAIDFEYYLSLQVLPPIERLCDSIEGTEKARLAECLGLDASKYASISKGGAEEEAAAFRPLQSQTSPEERFKDCERLHFFCPTCGNTLLFDGIVSSQQSKVLAGDNLRCPSASCRARVSLPSLVLQLQEKIVEHIARYYAGWVNCTDSGCRLRSRMTGVYARRCLATRCGGQTVQEYSDGALYTQLTYYAYLFDLEAQRSSPQASKNAQLMTQASTSSKQLLAALSHVVQTYLEKSGRKFVDLSSLFAGVTVM